MKHICLRSLLILWGLFFILFFHAVPAYAVVSGGTGVVSLSPATGTFPIGSTTNVDIMINTKNVPISGMQILLSYTMPSTPDLSATITPDPAMITAGWQFIAKSVTTSGSTRYIAITGVNSTAEGYKINTGTKFATIGFSPTAPFTSKVVAFDTTNTFMYKKSDASDFLGTPTNGSYLTSGSGVTIFPTATSTNAPNPTATSTTAAGGNPTATSTTAAGGNPTATPTTAAGGGNTLPYCASMTTSALSGTGTLTVTLSCVGIDPDGDVIAAKFTLGDGATALVEKNVGSPGTELMQYKFKSPGTYTASCIVQDNNFAWSPTSSFCSKTITVNPWPTRVPGSTAAPTTPTTPEPTALVFTESTPVIERPTPYPTLIPLSGSTKTSNGIPPVIWFIIGGLLLLVIGMFISKQKNQTPPVPPAQPQTTYVPPAQSQQPIQPQGQVYQQPPVIIVPPPPPEVPPTPPQVPQG